MAKDVSIVFKASDSLSNSIKQMQRSVNGLSRDVTEYRKVQDQAFAKKAEIKFDITKAKQELKELEKAVRQNVDGSEKAFKDKQKALEQLNEEYKRLTQVAKEASKAENRLQTDMHDTRNLSNTMSTQSQATQQSSMFSSLAGAGLGNMLGGAISGGMDQLITSKFGSSTGGAISGVVGATLSGAAIGSIAGPVGAAVGAAVGGLTGAINALAEKQQKADELLQGEVKQMYDLAKQEQTQSLTNGIGLAAKREKDMISYSTILGGEDNANKFLSDVQKFSAKTPFEMNDLLDTSKVMLSYGYKQDEILPMMTKIGDTGSALGIDSANQKVVATALGRMKSSGKTSLEYINQLSERAIPAIDYLAEALGQTNEGIYEMISKGAIDGVEASKIIVDAMGAQFEGNMAKQSETYDGLQSSLSDTWAQIDMSTGQGYTEKRKEGMKREISLLTDDVADNMKEANRLIGEYQASLENEHQEAIIKSVALAQDTEEYRKAEEKQNGAEMGRILAEARVKAENDYKNSEGYKMQQEADLRIVQDIQLDTAINGEYINYGKKMAEQFSKGYVDALSRAQNEGKFIPRTPEYEASSYVEGKVIPRHSGSSGGFATGLDRVPYNNMPALLHEGERIKTKVEADKEDKGMSGFNIAKLADSIVVREDADIDKIVSKLYSKFKKYAVNTA